MPQACGCCFLGPGLLACSAASSLHLWQSQQPGSQPPHGVAERAAAVLCIWASHTPALQRSAVQRCGRLAAACWWGSSVLPVGAWQVGRKEQWMCAAASFPLVYFYRVDCKGYLLHLFMFRPGWFLAPLTCCAISCTELAWRAPACLRVALMPTAGDCVRWGMVLACVWSWRLDGQPGCLWLLAQQPCEWVASRCETARDAMSGPCAPSSQDCHSSAPASKAAGKQARPLPCALLAHTRRHTLVWCLPAKPSLGHVAAWERGCAGRVGHGTPCCIEPPSQQPSCRAPANRTASCRTAPSLHFSHKSASQPANQRATRAWAGWWR